VAGIGTTSPGMESSNPLGGAPTVHIATNQSSTSNGGSANDNDVVLLGVIAASPIHGPDTSNGFRLCEMGRDLGHPIWDQGQTFNDIQVLHNNVFDEGSLASQVSLCTILSTCFVTFIIIFLIGPFASYFRLSLYFLYFLVFNFLPLSFLLLGRASSFFQACWLQSTLWRLLPRKTIYIDQGGIPKNSPLHLGKQSQKERKKNNWSGRCNMDEIFT
jgi:hypothetical protein